MQKKYFIGASSKDCLIRVKNGSSEDVLRRVGDKEKVLDIFSKRTVCLPRNIVSFDSNNLNTGKTRARFDHSQDS